MGTMASQITSFTIVYSTVYSGAVQRKHQSSASLAFVRGIHRGPVNSQHKGPVTRKMFPFDDGIMLARHKWVWVWMSEYPGNPTPIPTPTNQPNPLLYPQCILRLMHTDSILLCFVVVNPQEFEIIIRITYPAICIHSTDWNGSYGQKLWNQFLHPLSHAQQDNIGYI